MKMCGSCGQQVGTVDCLKGANKIASRFDDGKCPAQSVGSQLLRLCAGPAGLRRHRRHGRGRRTRNPRRHPVSHRRLARGRSAGSAADQHRGICGGVSCTGVGLLGAKAESTETVNRQAPRRRWACFALPTLRSLRYDNETGKGDHRHVGPREERYAFSDAETLLADFWRDVEAWSSE